MNDEYENIMEIKAIATEYKGYRFRSRLEARWAVFLDVCGEEWRYETEAFALSSGNYLPDFWLPRLDCWLEIKGREPTARQLKLCEELGLMVDKPVLIAWDLPSRGRHNMKVFAGDISDSGGGGYGWHDNICWCEDAQHNLCINGCPGRTWWTPSLQECFQAMDTKPAHIISDWALNACKRIRFEPWLATELPQDYSYKAQVIAVANALGVFPPLVKQYAKTKGERDDADEISSAIFRNTLDLIMDRRAVYSSVFNQILDPRSDTEPTDADCEDMEKQLAAFLHGA